MSSVSTNDSVATLQSGTGGGGGGGGKRKKDPLAPTPVPSWMGNPGDIWSQLNDQYGGVDAAFSTAGFDQAADEARGNIISASEEAANAAGADYAARARQAGGNAEGAGLIKAEALVSGRREAEDVRLKQMQYDIAQKEAAKQLASTIAGKMGDLRLGYLQNLTGWNEELQKNRTQIDVANISSGADYARTNELARQFDITHRQVNPNYDPYYALEGLPGGGGLRAPGTSTGTPGQNPYLPMNTPYYSGPPSSYTYKSSSYGGG